LRAFNYARIKKYNSVIKNEFELWQLYLKLMQVKEYAYDTETTTKDRVNGGNEVFNIVGISFSWGRGNNYYIPIGHIFDEERNIPLDIVIKLLKPVFERMDVRVIAHNLGFDRHVLKRIGLDILTNDVFDTMIASWLCDENTPNGLKDVSMRLLGADQTHFKETVETVTAEEKKMCGYKANNKVPCSLVRIDTLAPYALDDAYYTWELYIYFSFLLEEEEMEEIYFKMYMPYISVLFDMVERGIDVDLDKLYVMKEEMEADLDDLLQEIIRCAGIVFNPGSDQQLQELLFNYRGSKNPNVDILKLSFEFKVVSLTKKGAPSTAGAVLKELSMKTSNNMHTKRGIEMCRYLMKFKKLQTLKTTFIDGILKNLYDDNKLHCSYNIIGADSGRLSSSKPNLQNLPKSEEEDKYKIRSLFVSEGDEIIAIDYVNLETKVMAHFSKDPILLDMFEREIDSHGTTAVNMFNLPCEPDECKKQYPMLRQVGKVIAFLLAYGGGASALQETLMDNDVNLNDPEYLVKYGVKTGKQVAQIYIDKYFETFTWVANFIKNQKKFAKKYGYVNTILGRKRRLLHINGSDFGQASYEERLSVNAPIQGSAADLTSNAQIRIARDKRLVELRCFMLLQVHDELCFKCPKENVAEAIPIIQHYMAFPFGDDVHLNLPLTSTAGSGANYYEAK